MASETTPTPPESDVLAALQDAFVDAYTDDEVPWGERPRPDQVLAGLRDRGFDIMPLATPSPDLSALRAEVERLPLDDSCAHHFGNLTYDCSCQVSRAAVLRLIDRSGTDDGLDAAWREAEAALPEGGRLVLQHRPFERDFGRPRKQPATVFEAYATDVQKSVSLGFGYADTPAAALRNLAARLSATRSTDGAETPDG